MNDMDIIEPLIDMFGHIHTNLRVCVTDRCNIRYFYCMSETVRFLPRAEILMYDEIDRLVRAVAKMGVNRLRITGGEPLVRAELPRLIEMLAAVPGIRNIALIDQRNLAGRVSSGTQRCRLGPTQYPRVGGSSPSSATFVMLCIASHSIA